MKPTSAISEPAQEALFEQRFLLETLMDYIPDHIYFKDNQSRFLRINRAMAQRFNLANAAEAIGKTDFDFFTAEHAQQALNDEQELMRAGKPLVGREEKETWPDGSVSWVSTTKQCLRDSNGAVIGTFGISRDITARKQAEEALAAKTEELLRSNRDLEQFAYVASHDLQEPLRMIASYTQLLARRYQSKLDKEADEFIAYAVQGATRLQILINDLLAYSRLGTRGKPFEPVDCNEVLKRALENCKIGIQEAGATITSASLPTIIGDGTQWTQLFQNLISNAVKFRGPEPPRIHIAAELKPAPSPELLRARPSSSSSNPLRKDQFEHEESAENGEALNQSSTRTRTRDEHDGAGCEWVFSVTDNGIGIEPQYFERIFIIFQRLHAREEYPGTGIGLAICKKIVERHGGRIWVESALGQGTTFFFTAPQTSVGPRLSGPEHAEP